MSFKSSYIYTFIILVCIILLRENFNFTTGDREAYFDLDGWDYFTYRNIITAYIFSNLKYFGEVLFCILYYKNVFKLSSLLISKTRLKDYLNKRLVYYSILLCLFAPVTIIFTSFAGKDIIGIFLASELCIEILNYKYQIKKYKLTILKIFKFIILATFLFIIREITAIFLLILIVIFLALINRNIFKKKLSLIIFPISIFSIFLFSNQIYESLYQEFYYQWIASYSENATFSSTNPYFTLSDFFKNSYQMITSVSLIHFSESLTKSILILFNSFLTYIVTLLLSLIYFFKNLKIRNLFFFKAIFILLFFILNGFLSQNNPGGSIRYMSSIIPIYTTFIFALLPE